MNFNTKYRPQSFKDVVGQDSIVTVLSKEVETNNTKQAYLFVGKTGSGKSTSARILSKELNGYTIEIDAASKASAESMRELIDAIKPKPISHDKVVVILDEIQNCSKEAFSVLLLTIEQPPKHVVFIMCTTEFDKVPQAIINRCETFEFTNIDEKSIVKRLAYVCKLEGIKFDINALNVISQMSDGSMRQAITYLEQCSLDKDITITTVKDILLADSFDNYMNLIYAVCDKDYDSVVKYVKNASNIDKYVEGLFSFVLSAEIYEKTGNVLRMDIPEIYAVEFDKFSNADKNTVVLLRKMLTDLQYEGRNNPILRQLLISELYSIMG